MKCVCVFLFVSKYMNIYIFIYLFMYYLHRHIDCSESQLPKTVVKRPSGTSVQGAAISFTVLGHHMRCGRICSIGPRPFEGQNHTDFGKNRTEGT